MQVESAGLAAEAVRLRERAEAAVTKAAAERAELIEARAELARHGAEAARLAHALEQAEAEVGRLQVGSVDAGWLVKGGGGDDGVSCDNRGEIVSSSLGLGTGAEICKQAERKALLVRFGVSAKVKRSGIPVRLSTAKGAGNVPSHRQVSRVVQGVL